MNIDHSGTLLQYAFLVSVAKAIADTETGPVSDHRDGCGFEAPIGRRRLRHIVFENRGSEIHEVCRQAPQRHERGRLRTAVKGGSSSRRSLDYSARD